jgi:hypothetical protein
METVVIQRMGCQGVLAGLLGCVLGMLGILTFGVVFIPTAISQAQTANAPSPLTRNLTQDSGSLDQTKLLYSAVSSRSCKDFLQAYHNGPFPSVVEPVIAYVSERDNHSDGLSFGPLGSFANIIDYVATECRLHEEYKIGMAVEKLFDEEKQHILPLIPVGGATDEPKVHAIWDAFDKWIHHEGPRPVSLMQATMTSPRRTPSPATTGQDTTPTQSTVAATASPAVNCPIPDSSPSVDSLGAAARLLPDPPREYMDIFNDLYNGKADFAALLAMPDRPATLSAIDMYINKINAAISIACKIIDFDAHDQYRNDASAEGARNLTEYVSTMTSLRAHLILIRRSLVTSLNPQESPHF